MSEGIIAVFIPIILFLVTGLVIVTYFYFRSRERQLLIEKGLSADSIKEFFERKKDPFTMLKIGIVTVAAGLGLGLGLMFQDWTGKDYYLVLVFFTITGIGFITANIVIRSLNKKESGI